MRNSSSRSRTVADVYRVAAEEHITDAINLDKSGRYVLSHYVSGLAVECMLRACRHRIDSSFDSRHDLRELYGSAQFDSVVPESLKIDAGAALTELALRWQNSHRFRSEAALRLFLKKAGLNRGIKGDYLKYSSRRVVGAAITIVEIGKGRWNRS